jgi:hypothetical protein
MQKIINVNRFLQKEDHLYSFVLSAAQVVKLGRVLRFGEDAEGVNRKLDQDHAAKIAEAMVNPALLWLDPILGDLQGTWAYDEETSSLTFEDDSFLSIDDGQHRWHSLSLLNEVELDRLSFPIVATIGLPYERRLRLFRQQMERKAIDARLDLAQRHKLNEWQSPLDREAYEIVLKLNSDVTSPLRAKILLEEQLRRPYEGRHRPQGINGKGLAVTMRSIIGTKSPLHPLSPEKRCEIIMTMLSLVSRTWGAAWKSDKHILTTARGINAVLQMMVSSPNFRGTIGDNFSHESLRAGLELASTFDWSVGKNRNDSVKKIVERLDQSIGRNRSGKSMKTPKKSQAETDSVLASPVANAPSDDQMLAHNP